MKITDERVHLLYKSLYGELSEIPENFFVMIEHKNIKKNVLCRNVNSNMVQVVKGELIGYIIDNKDILIWFP